MEKIVIYVAMDVHGKSIVTGALVGDSESVLADRFPHEDGRIRRYLKRLSSKGEVRVCYEASSFGYVLYHKIRRWGYQCDVIAPSLVPKAPGERVKTDRRDARHLVLLYRGGMLRCISVPTVDQERDRALVRLRFQKQGDVNRLKQRILKFLRLRGYVYGGVNWSVSHLKWLRDLELAERDRYILDEYLSSLEYERSRLLEIDREIYLLSQETLYRDRVGKLRCFRGIDTLTAMVILTEIGDFARLKSAPAAMAYSGLVPSEHSSGESRRQGGTGYGGNRHLRYILVEAAWHYRHKPGIGKKMQQRMAGQPVEMFAYSLRVQRCLNRKFWKLTMRKSRQEAVVAVARELMGFLWGLMVQQDVGEGNKYKAQAI
jgi:transposase